MDIRRLSQKVRTQEKSAGKGELYKKGHSGSKRRKSARARSSMGPAGCIERREGREGREEAKVGKRKTRPSDRPSRVRRMAHGVPRRVSSVLCACVPCPRSLLLNKPVAWGRVFIFGVVLRTEFSIQRRAPQKNFDSKYTHDSV